MCSGVVNPQHPDHPSAAGYHDHLFRSGLYPVRVAASKRVSLSPIRPPLVQPCEAAVALGEYQTTNAKFIQVTQRTFERFC